jgi:succinate dehydrogenase hydrophobic anchor subunit
VQNSLRLSEKRREATKRKLGKGDMLVFAMTAVVMIFVTNVTVIMVDGRNGDDNICDET